MIDAVYASSCVLKIVIFSRIATSCSDSSGCMPPSLIFVGGDEIMLDDAALLHQKLLDVGCESLLTVTPDMWHGYILYGVSEAKRDLETIRHFLYEHLRG